MSDRTEPNSSEIARCIVDLIGIAAGRTWPDEPEAVTPGRGSDGERQWLREVVRLWREMREEEFALAADGRKVRQRALNQLVLAEVLQDLLAEFRDNTASLEQCKAMIRGVLTFHGEWVDPSSFDRDKEARFQTSDELRKWIRSKGPGDASKMLVSMLLSKKRGFSRAALAEAKSLRNAPGGSGAWVQDRSRPTVLPEDCIEYLLQTFRVGPDIASAILQLLDGQLSTVRDAAFQDFLDDPSGPDAREESNEWFSMNHLNELIEVHHPLISDDDDIDDGGASSPQG